MSLHMQILASLVWQQLTSFLNGSSSLGFGDRDDQSTTKPRKVPITSKLRRINPTFNLISVGSGGVRLQQGYAITTARKGGLNEEVRPQTVDRRLLAIDIPSENNIAGGTRISLKSYRVFLLLGRDRLIPVCPEPFVSRCRRSRHRAAAVSSVASHRSSWS